MGLFKSKTEKEFIGNKVSCAACGRAYSELKSRTLPPDLIKKYYAESVLQCEKCKKIYCSGSVGFMSCAMRGCSCSAGRNNFITKYCAVKLKGHR